jgi:hypothetical protein
MGRVYTAQFTEVTVSAAQDFFELLAPADAIVVVHELHLGQDALAGDSNEDILSILLKRGVGTVTSGSGGSVPTAQPVEDGDSAFGGTVEANNTTKMVVGTGTIEQLYAWAWNIRVPFEKIWTPETRPVISPSNRITVELANAPGATITTGVSGSITFEEVGG